MLEINDFNRLKEIKELNKKYFNSKSGYTGTSSKNLLEIHKPVQNKIKNILEIILNQAYFNKKFDITISKANKETNQFEKGSIRNLIWISFIPSIELNKLSNKRYAHSKLPQIQVSINHDKFVVASVWLEGNACGRLLREKFLTYLKENKLPKGYKITIYNKKEKTPLLYKNKLSEKEFVDYFKNKYYSLGIEKSIKPQSAISYGKNLPNQVIIELQDLIEDFYLPCFKLNIGKSKKNNHEIRNSRRSSNFDEVYETIRKGVSKTKINFRHKRIQNEIRKLLKEKYKDSRVIKLEEDFVDIKVEKKDEIILFEIKTDSSAISCLKRGLGQILFYSLKSEVNKCSKKQLVIVGLHKKSMEAKIFIKKIKDYLGNDAFKYLMYDDDSKILLSESES
ncbi:MAG TPA: hypothetical protein VFF33_08860 [Ignavibacteriaceae bacterium]|nr:hypothetical protein [Ignavibacteriaceae bacterium]